MEEGVYWRYSTDDKDEMAGKDHKRREESFQKQFLNIGRYNVLVIMKNEGRIKIIFRDIVRK